MSGACTDHPDRAAVGKRSPWCVECWRIRLRARKIERRKRIASLEGRVFKSRPDKLPPKPCKACGKELIKQSLTYCSEACKGCRPARASRPCSHCGGPRPPGSGQRQTCSDECAKARVAAVSQVRSHVGLRSEAHRAKRRAEKKVKYRRPDKAQIIARLTLEQGGMCAVCDTDGAPRGLVLDHDHATGDARLMLCTRCNAALGLMKEDPDRIKALLAYTEVVCKCA